MSQFASSTYSRIIPATPAQRRTASDGLDCRAHASQPHWRPSRSLFVIPRSLTLQLAKHTTRIVLLMPHSARHLFPSRSPFLFLFLDGTRPFFLPLFFPLPLRPLFPIPSRPRRPPRVPPPHLYPPPP